MMTRCQPAWQAGRPFAKGLVFRGVSLFGGAMHSQWLFHVSGRGRWIRGLGSALVVLAGWAPSAFSGVQPVPDREGQVIRYAPFPDATKAIHFTLKNGGLLTFDPERLRWLGGWNSGRLMLLGTPYSGAKIPSYCLAEGQEIFRTPALFPWQSEAAELDLVAEAPQSMRFLGVHLDSRQGPTVEYLLPLGSNGSPARFQEAVRKDGDFLVQKLAWEPLDRAAQRLHLEWEPVEGRKAEKLERGWLLPVQKGWLAVGLRGASTPEWVRQSAPVDYTTYYWEHQKNDSIRRTQSHQGLRDRLFLKLPVSTSGELLEVATGHFDNVGRAREALRQWSLKSPQPTRFLKPAAPAWGQGGAEVVKGSAKGTGGSGIRALGDRSIRLEQFSLPDEVNLQVTGMDLLPDGRIAVCTWYGDVWILSDLARPDTLKFSRFASGLCEPGGLSVVENAIVVAQKTELTRLEDTDQDGVADRYICLSQDWGSTGNYHDFTFGPVTGEDGRMMVYRTGNRGVYDVPYMGWALALDPVTGRADPICSGLRSPNGFGVHQGEAWMADNQGNWIGACTLNVIQPGRFYGFPSSRPAPPFPGEGKARRDAPALWFPYTLAKSVSDMKTIPAGAMGPFAGQLLVADWQNCLLTRVVLEKVEDTWQGAVFPFVKGFASGANRMVFAQDGNLYVGGCKNAAWAALGPKDASLDRVSYTGKLPFEVLQVKAIPDGFLLTFTEPVDRELASDPEAYDVVQFRYAYREKYGSPRFDQDGKENSMTPIQVVAADVPKNGRTVRLRLKGLKEGYVTMVRCLDVENDRGDSLREDTFWYTLNRIPAKH